LRHDQEGNLLRQHMNDCFRAIRTMQGRAQYVVLRGLLAVEAGEVAKAEAYFREALRVWQPYPNNPSVHGADFPGRLMAQEYLRRIEAAK
jgi:hypothetical protein